MNRDSLPQSESASAVQASEDSATYSLAGDLSSDPIAPSPEIETATGTAASLRPRRRTFRIRTSHEDRQTQSSWLAKFVLLAYFASFLIHFGLVLWMAYWTFQQNANEDELVLAGGNVVGIDPKLEEIIAIVVDLKAGEKSQASPARRRIDLVKQEDLDGEILTSIKDRLGETTISGDDVAGDLGFGDGTGGALPGGDIKRGKNAVTKGNFTAWTVPENPKVKEYYLIVIQIKLPQRTTRYRASDLSGIIMGTDTWRQRIPFDPRFVLPDTFRYIPDEKGKIEPVNRPPKDVLPIVDHVVTLIVKVPGAKKAHVRDTIQIRSKLLKEEQTLNIVFGKADDN